MVILRASRGTSAESDRSPAVSLIRRLQAGVWGLYRPTLDSRRGRVATRPQISTRCGQFRTHGRKCPQQCWCQKLRIWVESNYLGPGPSLARCGGRYRIWGVITISIPTGRTGHAERNSCAMWVGGVVAGRVVWWMAWIAGCLVLLSKSLLTPAYRARRRFRSTLGWLRASSGPHG